MSSSPQPNSPTPAELCPMSETDRPVLHVWRNDLATLPLWYPRRAPRSPEQFAREFQETEASTHVRFMVRAEGKSVGTVYSYNYNSLHGWAYLAVFIEAASRRHGLGSWAARSFAAWLFDNYPLRKLYAEVYGFNQESNATLQAAGIRPEAVLHEHLYWRGGYHDLLLYAVSREQFDATQRSLDTTARPELAAASIHSNLREGR